MPEIKRVKTGSKYENMASYSRAVAVGDLIFISNTAGRNPDTQEMPEDAIEQLHQVFANIERSLRPLGASLADIVSYRLYVPNPDDIYTFAPILGEKFKDIDPTATLICSPLAAPYYKVEMEAIAHREVSKHPAAYIHLDR